MRSKTMSKVKEGKKISDDQRADLKPENRGILMVGQPRQSDAEVEAQAHWEIVSCPYCGVIGRLWYYDASYHWYSCGSCGGDFRL